LRVNDTDSLSVKACSAEQDSATGVSLSCLTTSQERSVVLPSSASSSPSDCQWKVTESQEQELTLQEVACVMELPLNSFDWDSLLGTSSPFPANIADTSSFTFLTLQ
jgi:hypothetical protein